MEPHQGGRLVQEPLSMVGSNRIKGHNYPLRPLRRRLEAVKAPRGQSAGRAPEAARRLG